MLHLLYCAVLAQGALRPRPRQSRGAVPPAVQPGLHPGASPTPTRAASTCPPPRSSNATASSSTRASEVNQRVRQDGQEPEERRSSPDEICDEYGADTLRVYEMSMGPLDASRPWATKDVVGAYRFLQRVWRAGGRRGDRRRCGSPTTRVDRRDAARCCTARSPGCAEDYAALRYNTASAKLIELNNHLTKQRRGTAPRAVAEPLVLMLAPLAPHLAEELWQRLGHADVAGARPVPGGRPGATWSTTPSSTRCRSTARCAAGSRWPPTPTRTTVEAAALADEKVVALLGGRGAAQGHRGAGPAGQRGEVRGAGRRRHRSLGGLRLTDPRTDARSSSLGLGALRTLWRWLQ